jgi:ZIP family zinc transporter
MKNSLNEWIYKSLLGFASGVMIAASVWSLLIPSMEMSSHLGMLSCLPAITGFFLGIAFLFVIDRLIPHLHLKNTTPEGPKSKLGHSVMLILAVTIHNIPEGMAIGVVFSGLLQDNINISLASALTLSIGIAIQNFPEGAIISMPLRSEGNSIFKSFMYGTLSGIVEPIAAIFTLLMTKAISTSLPYFLSFAAGAMIYVVIEELLPKGIDDSNTTANNMTDVCIIGFAVGFALMMALDVIFG